MRHIRTVISLAIIALIVVSLVYFKDTTAYNYLQQFTSNFRQRVVQFISVKKHNFNIDFFPERRRPITLLDREAKLQQFLPNIFGEFSRQDWKEFWDFIYKPLEEKQGLSNVKRFREQDEIELYLKETHPTPFAYFKKEHWGHFWGIIF